jgi:hypothetical protein
MMKNLKRMLATVMMLGLVSAVTFGQKKDEPKRPPKDPDNKVVVKDKQPNNNNNSNRGTRGDRKP